MVNQLLKNKALMAGIAGAASIVVLIAMLVMHAWPLWTGQPIYLRVRPVDPRDFFRGDYVTLNYDISSLRLSPEEPKNEWQRGDYVKPLGKLQHREPSMDRSDSKLYVQLEKKESRIPGVPATYTAVSISDTPVPGMVNIAGRNNYRWWSGDFITLNYGIDAFFVEEHTGGEIEDAMRRSRPDVYAEVMVTNSGKARLRALIIDGKRIGG